MSNRLAELEYELKYRKKRLDWLGLSSTGADRHLERIAEIMKEIRKIKEGL